MYASYGGDSRGGLGGMVLLSFFAFVVKIVFCFAFWLFPLFLGFRYLKKSRFSPYASRSPCWSVWILPLIPAFILSVCGTYGTAALGWPETYGRFLFALAFVYLPFVVFFGPVGCIVGFLSNRKRFWRFPFLRMGVAVLCVVIGLAGVIHVNNDVRRAARADAFLVKNVRAQHNVQYVPPKVQHKRVCLAAYWMDKVMVDGPRPHARVVAGFLHNVAWVSVFAFDVTLLDIPTALMGRTGLTVHGAGVMGHQLDHRELLVFYLAFLGFGAAFWQVLMVVENFMIARGYGRQRVLEGFDGERILLIPVGNGVYQCRQL